MSKKEDFIDRFRDADSEGRHPGDFLHGDIKEFCRIVNSDGGLIRLFREAVEEADDEGEPVAGLDNLFGAMD